MMLKYKKIYILWLIINSISSINGSDNSSERSMSSAYSALDIVRIDPANELTAYNIQPLPQRQNLTEHMTRHSSTDDFCNTLNCYQKPLIYTAGMSLIACFISTACVIWPSNCFCMSPALAAEISASVCCISSTGLIIDECPCAPCCRHAHNNR